MPGGRGRKSSIWQGYFWTRAAGKGGADIPCGVRSAWVFSSSGIRPYPSGRPSGFPDGAPGGRQGNARAIRSRGAGVEISCARSGSGARVALSDRDVRKSGAGGVLVDDVADAMGRGGGDRAVDGARAVREGNPRARCGRRSSAGWILAAPCGCARRERGDRPRLRAAAGGRAAYRGATRRRARRRILRRRDREDRRTARVERGRAAAQRDAVSALLFFFERMMRSYAVPTSRASTCSQPAASGVIAAGPLSA